MLFFVPIVPATGIATGKWYNEEECADVALQAVWADIG